MKINNINVCQDKIETYSKIYPRERYFKIPLRSKTQRSKIGQVNVRNVVFSKNHSINNNYYSLQLQMLKT